MFYYIAYFKKRRKKKKHTKPHQLIGVQLCLLLGETGAVLGYGFLNAFPVIPSSQHADPVSWQAPGYPPPVAC